MRSPTVCLLLACCFLLWEFTQQCEASQGHGNARNTRIRRQEANEVYFSSYKDLPNPARTQIQVPETVMFPCNVSGTFASTTSVHRLRPSDIKVIGALGDSLLAANGALAVFFPEILIENRGVTWCSGGQGTWRQYLTVPNILKEFNPDLVGFSTGDSTFFQPASQLNVAIPGALDGDIVSQATMLISRIQNDPRIDFEKDWKMVTVLTGHNDICSKKCYNQKIYSAQHHKKKLIQLLDFLQDNLPRTFVNLLPVVNITRSTQLSKPLLCSMIQYVYCGCLDRGVGTYKENENEIIRSVHEFQKVEEEVVNSGRYDVRDDFTVVYQPFTINPNLPTKKSRFGGEEVDMSYLAHDCFHLSQKGHAIAANMQWNSMLQPVGRKNTDWRRLFDIFLCPSEEAPYFFTNKNSRSFLKSGRQSKDLSNIL